MRFAEEGPTAKELDDAKSYLIGSYPLRFDTSTKIAGLLLSIQLDNLGIDYIDKRNDLIAAVTIDDVRRVAKRLFSDSMVVVRVGQPSS
jgi:zinc protease